MHHNLRKDEIHKSVYAAKLAGTWLSGMIKAATRACAFFIRLLPSIQPPGAEAFKRDVPSAVVKF